MATDVPGCREIVRLDAYALLVQPDRLEMLANAIDRPAANAALDYHGRLLVTQECLNDRVVRAIVPLYKKLRRKVG